MVDGAAVDFFVVRKQREDAARPHWLIYRRSLNACVDAASNPAAAVEKAVKMAQFCALGGQSSQVHVREHDDAPWRTVWCPPHESRRFP